MLRLVPALQATTVAKAIAAPSSTEEGPGSTRVSVAPSRH
ncbi:MAG: hypothetical protein QOJ44_1910 [Acidimicrobiaceae bacterium]|nr:hypothetical protein [Acidimicrobiaceae bacterium]